ncbi:MAE_28990/MAE_18760 family HEPN-like nuclease [Xanthobacter versatilis]|uniref:MAE_28990/MAE_18760 family HEPN-like nuclease n=1 Tax=Xanthobacter autotrophicus (strain ATCC BAA-1158 / Py2) TaxID=78245 RepID=UPI00372AA142
MPSKARIALSDNLKDIDQLMLFHSSQGGSTRGRRHGLEVLNKSAIVLITSFWEAYCEDIADEALNHIVNNVASADKLPKELKKKVAKEIKESKNEIEMWNISDQNWKNYILSRMSRYKIERDRNLNTPKTSNINDLFDYTIGLKNISNGWDLTSKTNAASASAKLDKFIILRGSIAHRGVSSNSVKKVDVTKYLDLIKAIAAKTGGSVNSHVKLCTGTPLW